MTLTYHNITEETLKHFPEYAKTSYFHAGDIGLPSSFFFGFTRYILKKIQMHELQDSVYSDPVIIAAFNLFREMEWSQDAELSSLVLNSVFDELVIDKTIREIAFKLLGEKSHEHLLGSMIIRGIKES